MDTVMETVNLWCIQATCRAKTIIITWHQPFVKQKIHRFSVTAVSLTHQSHYKCWEKEQQIFHLCNRFTLKYFMVTRWKQRKQFAKRGAREIKCNCECDAYKRWKFAKTLTTNWIAIYFDKTNCWQHIREANRNNGRFEIHRCRSKQTN